MSTSTLHLEIVTPESKAYSADVDSVVIPTEMGEIQVLPNHVPLVTTMQPGDLQVFKDGKVEDLAVGLGFIEITGAHVTVLTDMALKADQINESAVEDAIKRAQEALKNQKASPDEAAALMASLQKSIAQLSVKKKKKS